MKKPRSFRSPQELRKISNHVIYEIKMLIETSQMEGKNCNQHNAILESFLIHTRNLIDFLWRNPKYPDDVSVNDFLNDDFLELSDEIHKDLTNKISKHLAHITYTRNKPKENKGWEKEKILNIVHQRLDEFFCRVDKDLLGEEWHNGFKDYWNSIQKESIIVSMPNHTR